MKDCSSALKEMLAAIEGIEQFTAGMNRDGFQADVKTVSADRSRERHALL